MERGAFYARPLQEEKRMKDQCKQEVKGNTQDECSLTRKRIEKKKVEGV
jgi:hypothetical protein